MKILYPETHDYLSSVIRQGRRFLSDLTPEEQRLTVITYTSEFDDESSEMLIEKSMKNQFFRVMTDSAYFYQFREELVKQIFQEHKNEIEDLFDSALLEHQIDRPHAFYSDEHMLDNHQRANDLSIAADYR